MLDEIIRHEVVSCEACGHDLSGVEGAKAPFPAGVNSPTQYGERINLLEIPILDFTPNLDPSGHY